MRTLFTRMSLVLCFLMSSIGCCSSAVTGGVASAQTVPANSSMNGLENAFHDSTALLFGQLEDGGLKMYCTATAYEHVGNVYHFVTAAHCVSEDDIDHERAEIAQTNWFITFDDPKNMNFIAAKVLRAGYQHNGDDFAVLEVILDKPVPTIPLAKDDPSLGEPITNIASPLGLGKQLFRGHVSMEHLNRPLISGDINWKGASLLQMSCGPGSSGSSIVSTKQNGIIAFLVGVVAYRESANIVAIPVSRFKKFNADVAAGKYKWHKPDEVGGLDAARRAGASSNAMTRIWKRIHETGVVYNISAGE